MRFCWRWRCKFALPVVRKRFSPIFWKQLCQLFYCLCIAVFYPENCQVLKEVRLFTWIGVFYFLFWSPHRRRCCCGFDRSCILWCFGAGTGRNGYVHVLYNRARSMRTRLSDEILRCSAASTHDCIYAHGTEQLLWSWRITVQFLCSTDCIFSWHFTVFATRLRTRTLFVYNA